MPALSSWEPAHDRAKSLLIFTVIRRNNVAEARRFYDAYPALALQLILKPPS